MQPEKIGKYEKLEQIGHGSTANIWLARDSKLHRQVALKIIEAEVPDKDELFEEPRMMISLEHPHIVRIYDADVIDGLPVIVMEYIKGMTLEKRLNAEDKCSIDESLRILTQILLALEAAHANRIVHGDMKPANILLDGSGQVKVTDFGLAKTLASHGYMQGAGTYAYMAPEDFSHEPATDARKDIWSVGVILYRMLTGARPYNPNVINNPFDWQQALKVQTPRPLSDFVSDAPAFLQDVVSRALHVDKRERFQTASDFLKALNTDSLNKLPHENKIQPVAEQIFLLDEQQANELKSIVASTRNQLNSIFLFGVLLVIVLIATGIVIFFNEDTSIMLREYYGAKVGFTFVLLALLSICVCIFPLTWTTFDKVEILNVKLSKLRAARHEAEQTTVTSEFEHARDAVSRLSTADQLRLAALTCEQVIQATGASLGSSATSAPRAEEQSTPSDAVNK